MKLFDTFKPTKKGANAGYWGPDARVVQLTGAELWVFKVEKFVKNSSGSHDKVIKYQIEDASQPFQVIFTTEDGLIYKDSFWTDGEKISSADFDLNGYRIDFNDEHTLPAWKEFLGEEKLETLRAKRKKMAA